MKHQIFVSKHLPVQTLRNKHYQKIFNLFFYCLLRMLNGITYKEVEIQSTVPHLLEQLIGNSPTITSQLFFKSLLVNGSRGASCFFYSRTLQVSFWNIEIKYRGFFLYCASIFLT